MYKVKHKLLPSYVVNIFDENETSHQLRNENGFKIPRCQSSVDINSRNIRRRDLAGVLEDNCENWFMIILIFFRPTSQQSIIPKVRVNLLYRQNESSNQRKAQI